MMTSKYLTQAEIEQFNLDGYLFVEDLLTEQETEVLMQSAQRDRTLKEHAHEINDGAGRKSKLSLWDHAGDDIYGAIARSRKVAERMEGLLGDEVYHYHSKVMLKEPRVGGAWQWHQDYGYWYMYGCLWPDMASCLIAIDQATRENGCLQVVKGSHRLGRLDHGLVGDQTGIDQGRIDAILERMELVYCEMKPGTGLFFHGNLLHRSDANLSDKSRWSYIICYNTAHNDPYKDSNHSKYAPLKKVDDATILDYANRESDPDKDYYSQEKLSKPVQGK